MTVSVNPVSRPANDMDQLSQAVGLALKFYDIKLNADQQKAANGLLAKKAEEDARKEGAKFGGDHEAVTSRPAAGPFVPLDQAPSFARSAAPEGTVGYVPASFGQKNREIAVQEDNLNYNRDRDDRERFTKHVNDFKNDGDIEKIKVKVEAANFIDNLLTEKNPIMDAVALRQTFKLSGDVGAIKPEDLRDLGASPALKDQALLALEQMRSGQRIDDESRKAISRMAEIVRQQSRSSVSRIANRYADTAARDLRGVNKNDMLNALAPETVLAETPRPQSQQSAGGGLSAEQIAAKEILEERMRAKQTGGRTR